MPTPRSSPGRLDESPRPAHSRGRTTEEGTVSEVPDKQCDLVMKGGITSGVVYPRAISRIARDYRLVNVGGASAGAIAAVVAAACEYRRHGDPVRGVERTPTAFDQLEAVRE